MQAEAMTLEQRRDKWGGILWDFKAYFEALNSLGWKEDYGVFVSGAEGDRRRVAAIQAKIAADQQRGRGGGRGGGTGAAEEPSSTAAEQVRQTETV